MPRHSPNALTSHLRVHTTNDNPDIPAVGMAFSVAMMRMIVFFLSQILLALIVMTLVKRRTAFLKPIEPARHRLKNPFTMSKCR